MADFLASDCAREQARGGRWASQLHGFHRRSRCQADSWQLHVHGSRLHFKELGVLAACLHSPRTVIIPRHIIPERYTTPKCTRRIEGIENDLFHFFMKTRREKTASTSASDGIQSVRYPIIDEIFWLPVRMQITLLSLRVEEWANGSSPDLVGSRNGNSCDH
jgi:hypothetical protein